jgi:hypothetical protein
VLLDARRTDSGSAPDAFDVCFADAFARAPVAWVPFTAPPLAAEPSAARLFPAGFFATDPFAAGSFPADSFATGPFAAGPVPDDTPAAFAETFEPAPADTPEAAARRVVPAFAAGPLAVGPFFPTGSFPADPFATGPFAAGPVPDDTPAAFAETFEPAPADTPEAAARRVVPAFAAAALRRTAAARVLVEVDRDARAAPRFPSLAWLPVAAFLLGLMTPPPPRTRGLLPSDRRTHGTEPPDDSPAGDSLQGSRLGTPAPAPTGRVSVRRAERSAPATDSGEWSGPS